ncbi:MAG: hypothetical protein ABIP21_12850 [Acidimicrobiia bacterium]
MGVFGYLDAGSGSMIVGAVAAGAAGVAVAAKVGWRRMTGGFGKKSGALEPAPSADAVAEPTPVDSVLERATDET